MRKKKSVQEEPITPLEQDKVIKEPGQKIPFWKPKVKGQNVVGKLVRISSSRFSKLLTISTDEGSLLVPVSVFLSDIDFEQYLGRNLYFSYEGLAGRMKLFKVVLLTD